MKLTQTNKYLESMQPYRWPEQDREEGKNVTVCLATICEDNSALVLASDCMITSGALSIQFEHSRKKMTRLSDHCMALTAGDALAHTELFNMVQSEIEKLKSPSVIEVVANIKDCYQIIRKKVIIESILKPKGFDSFEDFYQAQRSLIPDVAMSIQGKIEKYDYGLSILVAGMADNTAHIYGVSNPGTSQCFDSLGFHAIGSGMRHAIDTFITRGCNQGASLEEAFLMTYGAKKIAEFVITQISLSYS